MDIINDINIITTCSDCFTSKPNSQNNNINISDEAMNIACTYFREVFPNIKVNER